MSTNLSNTPPENKPPAPIFRWGASVIRTAVGGVIEFKGVALFSAGASTVSAFLYSLLAYDADVSYHRILLGASLNFAAVFAGFFFSLLLLQKGWRVATGKGAQQTAEVRPRVPAPEIENPQEKIRELEAGRRNDEIEIGRLRREAEKSQERAEKQRMIDERNRSLLDKYKWAHEHVEYQLSLLRKYVLVQDCIINAVYLSEGNRFLEFTFHVINYSMFHVSIPMPLHAVIEGSIYFKGEPLSGAAKLFKNGVDRVRPMGVNSFVLRQWVDSGEAADILESLQTVGNLFNFSEAAVYIKADKFPDMEAAKLDLTRGMQNADFENKIIELENANARLGGELASRQERARWVEELHLALGACYQAYNQTERGEELSEATLKNLKMRIAYALALIPNEPKGQFEIYDQLPPMPESIGGQKEWIDAQCFRLREVIEEQRERPSENVQGEGSMSEATAQKPIVITKATYWFDSEHSSDVTQIIASMVSNGGLTIRGKYKDFLSPDPKKGVRKNLTVDYLHDGLAFSVMVAEDTELTLPIPYKKGR